MSEVAAQVVHWMTTAPNPRSRASDEPRGWKLHAVMAAANATCRDVRFTQAACGLRAAHGWGVDLFIEKKCARCLRKLGIACAACKGTGSIGKVRDGTHLACYGCDGGERKQGGA